MLLPGPGEESLFSKTEGSMLRELQRKDQNAEAHRKELLAQSREAEKQKEATMLTRYNRPQQIEAHGYID